MITLCIIFLLRCSCWDYFLQCIIATVLVEMGRRFGAANYDPFSLGTAQRWLPVSIFFSCMLFTSFKAFEIMNVPMVSTG